MKTKTNKEIDMFIDAINDMSYEDVLKYIDENYDSLITSLPSGEYKKKLLLKVYKNHLSRNAAEGHTIVQIYQNEIDFLAGLPTSKLKRLFYSLIISQKVQNHPSGWNNFCINSTKKYGFIGKDLDKIRLEDYSACTSYGFDTRVIGSNNPILCFKLELVPSGDPIISFEDGEAAKMFSEVMKLASNK